MLHDKLKVHTSSSTAPVCTCQQSQQVHS